MALVEGGACDGFGPKRRDLLWELGLATRPTSVPGTQGAAKQLTLSLDPTAATPALRDLTRWERMAADYRLTGSLGRRAPAPAPAAASPGRNASERRSPPCGASLERRLCGSRDREAATLDRQRDRVHAARGRMRPGEPDRARRTSTSGIGRSSATSRCSSLTAATSGWGRTGTFSSRRSRRWPHWPGGSPISMSVRHFHAHTTSAVADSPGYPPTVGRRGSPPRTRRPARTRVACTTAMRGLVVGSDVERDRLDPVVEEQLAERRRTRPCEAPPTEARAASRRCRERPPATWASRRGHRRRTRDDRPP